MAASTSAETVSELLAAAAQGDTAAIDRLYPLVYDDLRRRASRQRRALFGGATLNTTALVHESYFKLMNSPPAATDRAHFLAIAARAMRQVLVNYAERQHAQKRGGGVAPASLHEARFPDLIGADRTLDMLALDRALERLEAAVGERPARIVECRFFAGLTVAETAEALGVSEPTVKRGWRAARAWLYTRLADDVSA